MILFRYNPILHRLALLTTAATFPLIFMGGLVTSHGAGMSVPDWPNSYGYNMWLYPPSQWWNGGGIFYEHSHRLMGTVVGFLSLLLAIAAWKMERRVWVRRLAYFVLASVIIQGVIGGMRVRLVNKDIAIVHGVVAQIFFCVAALSAIVTSRWWNRSPNLGWSEDYAAGRKLIRIVSITFGVLVAQLVVAAVMRHAEAGLAIPDVPLSYGKLLPPTSADGLAIANAHRAFKLNLDPVSPGQIWLQFAHRIGAIVATGCIGFLAWTVFRNHRGQKSLVIPTSILCGLLLTQITLGVMTVLMKKPADIASAHVACGALLFLTCFTVGARSMRLYSRCFRTQAAAVQVSVQAIGSREFLTT